MRRLQEQGKARYIGITGYPLTLLARIAETVRVDTILTYCRYNLMVTDIDDVLTPAAKKHGTGLINASPLHMGLLTSRGAPDRHPASVEVREASRKALEICRKRGVALPDLALRFCLVHPYVSTTLVGMSNQAHVKTNPNVLQMMTDLELVETIRALVGPVLNYVWPSGRSENHDATH
jgi:L-galactose dehydrogenase